MLYQSKTSLEPIPPTINILLLLSFGGGVLTAVQTLLVVIQGDIICLNQGCEIVESLTTVPPLVFNLVGLGYFSTVFWLLWLGKNRNRAMLKFARLMLLCGFAAEGVLVSYQYYVAEVFCSYCLIILAFVVLLNLLMGVRQMIVGTAFFVTVALAFSSLQFVPRSEIGEPILASGSYGQLVREPTADEHYLFFSSTCPHCEEVIATIDEGFSCTLNFNPIDVLTRAPHDEVVASGEYDPRLNRRYLKSLGITEIPALAVVGGSEIRVFKGKQKILEYLNENCRTGAGKQALEFQMSTEAPYSNAPGSGFNYLSPTEQEDGCSVDVDCETDPAQEQQ